ncbi:MAG: cob(I)yrinic acid a,c-diamide adenosyltransferase [Candidatus Caldarchaeum sp.]
MSRENESETFLPRVGRVRKSHPRVEAFGAIDELSSFIGLARSMVSDAETKEILKKVQNSLFHVGSYLAVANHPIDQALGVRGELETFERKVKKMLPPLTRFIYPGGVTAAAALHVCRAVARRAERTLVRLSEQEPVDQAVISYMNYLSKFFFTVARYINAVDGGVEEEWVSR